MLPHDPAPLLPSRRCALASFSSDSALATPPNVRFQDLHGLLVASGLELDRISGSHHIYVHAAVRGRLSLQEVGGQAKPYQVLEVLDRYDLGVKEDR